MSQYTIINADCRDAMRGLDPCSVDSIVTDPPYGLSFMGKDWDHGVPGEHFWREALRVAKPGAHLLAFGGTRTFHRLACAIEDAGWEIRDTLAWVYGSGFPKSLDVSKVIDKAAGAEREVVGRKAVTKVTNGRGLDYAADGKGSEQRAGHIPVTAPATPAARQWSGWGTALKPAFEPVILARKPLDSTVAANVLKWGTGAVNVDGCRVGDTVETWHSSRSYQRQDPGSESKGTQATGNMPAGRWPANFIHDGSDEVVGLLGEAARFFYCPKASKADRDEGCEGLDEFACGMMEDDNYDIKTGSGNSRNTRRRNHHPTVKPTDLMRYLCRLVTPPGGVVLDPFMGSGSTGKAAVLEGFRFIGIDLSAEYVEIARARIAHAQHDGAALFAGAVP